MGRQSPTKQNLFVEDRCLLAPGLDPLKAILARRDPQAEPLVPLKSSGPAGSLSTCDRQIGQGRWRREYLELIIRYAAL
jgi:hypothetical protein